MAPMSTTSMIAPLPRTSSIVGSLPASCSRRTPIICSSVNLDRFICPSFTRPDSNFTWRNVAGAGFRQHTFGGNLGGSNGATNFGAQGLDLCNRLRPAAGSGVV